MSDQKKAYKTTAEGSLGLLALGDIGIEKWREAKAEKKADELNSKNDTTTPDGEKTDK